MALAEIDVTVTRVGAHGALFAVDGADVTVQNSDGSARTVYANQAGTIVATQPLKSRNGRIDGYVDVGAYLRYRAVKSGELTDNPPWEYFYAGGPKGPAGPVGGTLTSAVGDGVADDTAAIQTDLNAGGLINFPPGIYKITGKLTGRSDLHLRLAPGAIIDARSVSVGTPWFEVVGTTSNATALSANAAEADIVLSVAAGAEASFVPGDLVQVRSNRQPDTAQPKDGEIHFVDTVASGQIQLEGGLWDAYTTADVATVEKITAIRNIIIEGGKIIGAGVDGVKGVFLEYCRDVRFRGVTFENFTDLTVQMISCVVVDIKDCFVYWANQAGRGYGFMPLNASQWVNITGNTFIDNRHGVSGGGFSARYGRPRHVVVDGNNFYGGRDSGVDSHSPGQHWVIANNVIECGGFETDNSIDGIAWQGTDVVISDNVILNPKRHGILIQLLRASDVVRGITITGNVIRNPRDRGILVEVAGASTALGGLVISSNSIYSSVNDAIFAWTTATGATLTNFAITDNVIAASKGRGIYVRSNTGVVSWGVIANNRAELAAALETIYLYTATAGNVSRVAVNGNTANGGTYGIRGSGQTNCFVDGNIAIGSSGGLLGFAAGELGANMTT